MFKMSNEPCTLAGKACASIRSIEPRVIEATGARIDLPRRVLIGGRRSVLRTSGHRAGLKSAGKALLKSNGEIVGRHRTCLADVVIRRRQKSCGGVREAQGGLEKPGRE